MSFSLSKWTKTLKLIQEHFDEIDSGLEVVHKVGQAAKIVYQDYKKEACILYMDKDGVVNIHYQRDLPAREAGLISASISVFHKINIAEYTDNSELN